MRAIIAVFALLAVLATMSVPVFVGKRGATAHGPAKRASTPSAQRVALSR